MKKVFVYIFFCLLNFNLFAQDSPTVIVSPKVSNNTPDTSSTSPVNPQKTHFRFGTTSSYYTNTRELVFPTVGLGIGVLSFYGDVKNNISKSPLNGRIASELDISQRISECFIVQFHTLIGKLGANERFTSDNRNINFQSSIIGGGISLVYDFGNLLPKDRNASPFISLGITSFEFLSKTDLKDKNGNTYYYWSDGTIRNVDQNSPNANTAIILKRDYNYESDMRNTTFNQLGKYPVHTFAIPLGIGFSFRINNFITFRVSSTMYYSFTDNIDGIAQKNYRRIIPAFKYDNFMMSSWGLSYNFGYKHKAVTPAAAEGFKNHNVDFYKINITDLDKDGVPDIKDNCQKTPAKIAVDTAGCPYDDDDDGFPNYKDKEINSPPGSIVTTKGVHLTDSSIFEMYDRYRDTTMKYAVTESMEYIKPVVEDKFLVSIGTYKKSDFMKLPSQILSDSLPFMEIKITDSTSMYLTDKYNYISEAVDRREQLITNGISADSARVMVKQNGAYLYLDPTRIPKDTSKINKKIKVNDINNNAPTNDNVPVNPEKEKPKWMKFLFRSRQKSE
jgi:hypothetical protein